MDTGGRRSLTTWASDGDASVGTFVAQWDPGDSQCPCAGYSVQLSGGGLVEGQVLCSHVPGEETGPGAVLS